MGLPAEAKIRNTISQNQNQYGKETDVVTFSQPGQSFTGYRTYSASSKWFLTAFFKNGTVRSEHLFPKKEGATLTRSQVRNWAAKMFAQQHRGVYRRQLNRYRAQGHFFDLGLVAYEYFIVKKATKGFQGVKVLLYEGDKKYWQINPKAYI